jgi:predicted AAA+ superfamily ATPase
MIKKLINRGDFIQKIKNGFRSHNIVALLGPRQCGKTTLANQYKEIAFKQGLPTLAFFPS